MHARARVRINLVILEYRRPAVGDADAQLVVMDAVLPDRRLGALVHVQAGLAVLGDLVVLELAVAAVIDHAVGRLVMHAVLAHEGARAGMYADPRPVPSVRRDVVVLERPARARPDVEAAGA